LLPVQVNLFELGDYIDAWEMLDQVVLVVAGEDGRRAV
jgi:hypothetical protein